MSFGPRNFLISGSSGYLGGVTAKTCERLGFGILATSRRPGLNRNVSFEIDIRANDIEAVARQIAGHKCRAVLHFATKFSRSTSGANIEDLVSANLEFSIKLAEAARMAGVPRFINVASTWEMTRKVIRGADELLTPYASSKRAFRAYLDERFGDNGYVKNVFLEESIGPYDHRDKIVPNLIRSSLSGAPMEVRDPNLGLNFALAESLANFMVDEDNHASMPYEFGYISYTDVTIAGVAAIIKSIHQSEPSLQIAEGRSNRSARVSLPELGLPIIWDPGPPPLEDVLRNLVESLSRERAREQNSAHAPED